MEQHLYKGTQMHLPLWLFPSLLSSFIFLTPSSLLSVIHAIFLSLASYTTALLLGTHICTSLPTHTLDLICYISVIRVSQLLHPKNRVFISVLPNKQISK